MDKIGFIGYGSMGRMLAQGLLRSGMVTPAQICVTTRSPAKLGDLQEHWTGVSVVPDAPSVVQKSDVVFLCVKPLEVPEVLAAVRSTLRPTHHLVSIAACVRIAEIEQACGPELSVPQISKVIPSLTSEVGAGVSLVCHNAHVPLDKAHALNSLLGAVSTVMEIAETDFEVAADLTSCGPGLIAALFREFVEAGIRHSGLSRGTATEMVIRTLSGTARLLAETGLEFQPMIDRVATPGGITQEGVAVLQARLPSIYDEVFARTLDKHETVSAAVRERFAAIKHD